VPCTTIERTTTVNPVIHEFVIRKPEVEKIRVLHIASFSGNIGDNASHQGLANVLGSLLPDYKITRLEIRNFYKNAKKPHKKYFDESFVEYVNSFDLVIFGGGGYLDYWVEGSATGCTFDIEARYMDRIKVPFLLASLGCVPGKQVPNGNSEKFLLFLKKIAELDNFQLLLRNDGSLAHIKKKFGSSLAMNFATILDNAFHYSHESAFSLPSSRPFVTLNMANDQIRMKGEFSAKLNPDQYFKGVGALIEKFVMADDLNVCLVPHIPEDFVAINALLNFLPEKISREAIIVSPYLVGDLGANAVFSIYRQGELTIGNRFHSNVCSVNFGIKSIGISALERVSEMYNSLGLLGNYIDPSEGFEDRVYRESRKLLDFSGERYAASIATTLKKHRAASIDAYRSSLSKIGV
jgi:polysaccharide pyruvyl transferase WcaK-like protein